MNRSEVYQRKVWILFVISLLVGCSTSTGTPMVTQPAEASVPTAEPRIEAVAEFEVTFDGIECSVSGPTETVTGPHTFILNDSSDLRVELWVGGLLEGRTVQDLIDGQSEPGEWYPKPSWAFYASEIGRPWMNEDGREVFAYALDEEGRYFIYVGIYLADTKNLWFCNHALVALAPSE